MATMSAGIDESMLPDLNGWLVSTSACTGFLGTICMTHMCSNAHVVTICQAPAEGRQPGLQHHELRQPSSTGVSPGALDIASDTTQASCGFTKWLHATVEASSLVLWCTFPLTMIPNAALRQDIRPSSGVFQKGSAA